jgi:hypothetical protein
MLLEVLIAIAILALAIAFIGGQVDQSLRSAEYSDQLNRALMLAECVLAELELGPVQDDKDRLIDLRGDQGEGTFGERYPGFGWRVKREPTEVENLDLITIEILQGDPEDSAVDQWKTLHSVYTLRPILPNLDPADFGMPTEQDIDMLALASAQTQGDQNAMTGGGTGPLAGLPPQLEELMAALPPPIQEIVQRFLGGEPVPVEEIRTAVGELTLDDMLSLAMLPGLVSLLSGANLGGLGGQLPGGLGGGGGLGSLQQMLGGLGGDLQQLAGNIGGQSGGEQMPPVAGQPGQEGTPEGQDQSLDSWRDQLAEAGVNLDQIRQQASQMGIDIESVFAQAVKGGMDIGAIIQQARDGKLDYFALMQEARKAGIDVDGLIRQAGQAGRRGGPGQQGGGDVGPSEAPQGGDRGADVGGRPRRGRGGNRFGR